MAQGLGRLVPKIGAVCLRCGSTDELSIDHVVPKSRGGSNSQSNFQVLCKPCNVWKGDRVIDYRNVDMARCFARRGRDKQFWKEQQARDAGRQLWKAFLAERGKPVLVFSSGEA